MKQLTEEEKKIYQNIIDFGTKEDMFDFAYAIGRARLAEEQIKTLTSRTNL